MLKDFFRRVQEMLTTSAPRTRRFRRTIHPPFAAAIEDLEPRKMLSVTPVMIMVTTLSDTPQSGQETLRQAIATANIGAPGDTISFAKGLTGTLTLTQGDLNVLNSMTITGPGSGQLAISGNQSSRIFTINDNNAVVQNVTISGLTLTHGGGISATGSGYGGAILNQEHLTLINCVVSNNSAIEGGGVSTSGAISLVNNTFSGNGADLGVDLWNSAAPALPAGKVTASQLVAQNGTVYSLSTDGNLYGWNGSSSTWNHLDTTTKSFAVTSNGTLYFQQYTGSIYQITPNGTWSRLDTIAKTFALASDGTLYIQEYTGSLYQITPSGNWTRLDTIATDFVVAPNGTMYIHEYTGSLYSLTVSGTWHRFDTIAQSIAISPTGTLFVLDSNGVLSNLTDPSGSLQQRDTNVKSFQIATNGTVWVLENSGSLYFLTPDYNWKIWDTSVQTFQIAPNGTVWVQETSGALYSLTPDNTWKLLDKPIQSFQIAPNGTLWVLERSGSLYYLNPSNVWALKDTSVQTFQIAPNGTVWVQETSGALYSLTPDNMWKLLDKPIQSFQIAPNGTLWALERSGSLYYLNPSNVWALKDTSVQTFQIAPNGTVWVQETSGALYSLTPDNTWKLLDKPVQSFQVAPNGTMYVLETSGSLYSLTPDNTWAKLDVLVSSFQVTSNGTLLVNDWFIQKVPAFADQVRSALLNHGAITRSDLLSTLFPLVESRGSITQAEMTSLQNLGGNPGLLNMSSSVGYLANAVVSNNLANTYSGGNLVVGSSANLLSALVGQWFLGTGAISWLSTTGGTVYQNAKGSLFGSKGPSYTDVFQGALGDCGLIAAFAEVAYRHNSVIQNMFINNGDGTYTVQLYKVDTSTPQRSSTPVYVTVNTSLPNGGNSYAHVPNGVLWVALAEKAMVELNESGWLPTNTPGSNSYEAFDGTFSWQESAYLQAITGLQNFAWTGIDPSKITAAWNSGEMLVVGSNPTTPSNDPSTPNIVPSHWYAMIGPPQVTTSYQLFSPWGVDGGKLNNVVYKGTITVSNTQLAAWFSDTASAWTPSANSVDLDVVQNSPNDSTIEGISDQLKLDRPVLAHRHRGHF